jgi:hypothetical protein
MDKDRCIEYIKETAGSIEKLSDLMMWVYEQGWADGREDLKEEREG